jgi:hypothetical protein
MILSYAGGSRFFLDALISEYTKGFRHTLPIQRDKNIMLPMDLGGRPTRTVFVDVHSECENGSHSKEQSSP